MTDVPGGALLAAFAFVALVSAAQAVESCGGALTFDGENDIRLMRVAPGAGRVHFVAGPLAKIPGCPSAAPACLLKNFLVPGDEVLAGAAQGGFVCVTFRAGKGRETSGFLPAASLAAVVPVTPKITDWAGKWARASEAEIEIFVKGDTLDISGDATYGARDPVRVKSGGVNLGNIAGDAKPRGNAAALGEGYDGAKSPAGLNQSDCKVRLRLFGRYLVAEDNLACGGHNVSFTGVYVK